MKKALLIVFFTTLVFGQNHKPQRMTTEEAFQLLNKAKYSLEWKMRERWGPDDSNHEQIIAFYTLRQEGILDWNGQFIGEPPSNFDDVDAQWWMEKFTVSTTDTEGILKLLNDPSPAIRYLGLQKLPRDTILPDTLILKLEDMIQNDGYVRLTYNPPAYPPGFENKAQGRHYSDFEAKLREQAAAFLRRQSEYWLEVDNYQVALLGLEQFNAYCEGGRDINVIMDCLYNLGDGVTFGIGYGYNVWREARENRDLYPQLATLFYEWDKRKNDGIFPPDPRDNIFFTEQDLEKEALEDRRQIILENLKNQTILEKYAKDDPSWLVRNTAKRKLARLLKTSGIKINLKKLGALEQGPTEKERLEEEKLYNPNYMPPPLPSRPASRAWLWLLALPVVAGVWVVERFIKRK